MVDGLNTATAIAVDAAGQMYVGFGEPENQIKVFSPAGKLVKAIGRARRPGAGRSLDRDGVRFVDGMALDSAGKLWVMENDWTPKRQSVWNVETGKLVREMFGVDQLRRTRRCGLPRRSDGRRRTGLRVADRSQNRPGRLHRRHHARRHGKLSLCHASRRQNLSVRRQHRKRGRRPAAHLPATGRGPIQAANCNDLCRRAGQGIASQRHGKPSGAKQTVLWSDANDDGQRQADEMSGIDGEMRVNGWFLWATPEGSLYSKDKQFKMLGLTACGAPRYDLAHADQNAGRRLGLGRRPPGPDLEQGGDRSRLDAGFDIASGKLLWEYPDTFVGVHGSHNAPPPVDGLIRGAFPPCGTVKLPDPIGNIWVIPTNVGEWHILTEHGYYLTRLFQPDPLKVEWPEVAKPGANLDKVPPGSGGEDFGGSITLGHDGKLYLQSGKTAFWDIEVVGLDTVKALPMGTVTIEAGRYSAGQQDSRGSTAIHRGQAAAGGQKANAPVHRKSGPRFCRRHDPQVSKAGRSPGACHGRLGRSESLSGLGSVRLDSLGERGHRSRADVHRRRHGRFSVGHRSGRQSQARRSARGDLRLSIGPFQKKPQAVVYRRVADETHPRSFQSGVFQDYVMQSVLPLEGAEIVAKTIGKDHYVVEAKVPLAALGLTPRVGLELHGDFGVTHGDPAGQRTRLRTYWSNQHTGIVDDAVAELKMEPRVGEPCSLPIRIFKKGFGSRLSPIEHPSRGRPAEGSLGRASARTQLIGSVSTGPSPPSVTRSPASAENRENEQLFR